MENKKTLEEVRKMFEGDRFATENGAVIMIIECRNDYFRFDKPILSAFA